MTRPSRPKSRRYSVRIIGGRWRGRRIAIPLGTTVRPTADRVRETVFNWLADAIAGALCLDLFAGTGVLGFEALSRGAREALFVERDAKLARALREHIAALGADAQVAQTDVDAFLERAPPRQFDIVFLDPPYSVPLEPALVLSEPWLADTAWIYVERPHSRAESDALASVAHALPGAKLFKHGRAGGVAFGMLRFERS